jgi:O-antigen ligase
MVPSRFSLSPAQAGGWTRPLLTRPGPETAALGAVVVLAVALGWIIARYDGFGAGIGTVALVTAGALAALAVIRIGPVACIVAFTAFAATGYRPEIAEVGGAHIYPSDVFYVGLVGWWLLAVIGRAQQWFPDPRPRIGFGKIPALLLFGYVALTFVHVANSNPAGLEDSVIGWLRFVQTASIALLVATLIGRERDVRIVLASLALAGVVAVALAAGNVDGLLSDRARSDLGPNALGMVAGLTLLIGAFGAVTPKMRYRIAIVAAGVLGLVLAKSVASFVATGLALALGAGLTMAVPGAQRPIRLALGAIVAGVVVFSAVQAFRPEVLPGSDHFEESSAAHRVVVGAAGLEIFERNPLIGVGWRQSSEPDVIGDREVVNDVRRRFQEVRPSLFPDVRPTSVHSSYVQILAELGLVGFALFTALIAAIAASAWKLLRSLDRNDKLWREAWAMSMGLVLVLVWLNDNPLFGGQPETEIMALLLGALAATSRICARRQERTRT